MVKSAAIAIECVEVETSKAILTTDRAHKFEVIITSLYEFGLGDRPHSSERALIRERSVVDFDVAQHLHIAHQDFFVDVVEQRGAHSSDRNPLNLSAWVKPAMKTIAEKIIGGGGGGGSGHGGGGGGDRDERSLDL